MTNCAASATAPFWLLGCGSGLLHFAAHAADEIMAHIFQSAMNDQSGYLKLAGLFFSMKKWPNQAKP